MEPIIFQQFFHFFQSQTQTRFTLFRFAILRSSSRYSPFSLWLQYWYDKDVSLSNIIKIHWWLVLFQLLPLALPKMSNTSAGRYVSFFCIILLPIEMTYWAETLKLREIIIKKLQLHQRVIERKLLGVSLSYNQSYNAEVDMDRTCSTIHK